MPEKTERNTRNQCVYIDHHFLKQQQITKFQSYREGELTNSLKTSRAGMDATLLEASMVDCNDPKMYATCLRLPDHISTTAKKAAKEIKNQ